jgi:Chlorophyll A-B binding protein
MAKFTAALLASLVASSSAFVSQTPAAVHSKTALQATEGVWDPLGLYTLGNGKAFDTFPNVFPNEQYLEASEIKHGRQAMLAWTGVWATSQVRSCIASFQFFFPKHGLPAPQFLLLAIYRDHSIDRR